MCHDLFMLPNELDYATASQGAGVGAEDCVRVFVCPEVLLLFFNQWIVQWIIIILNPGTMDCY